MPATADASAIDACLPQTQCGRCGYPRCIDYARAIASDESNINRCPPGGEETITALATTLGTESVALAPELAPHRPPQLALIRERDCIGCTLCIQACPVDAIIGAAKLMHSVIADECTGCELCVPACPMDCIELSTDKRPVSADSAWRWFDPERVNRARRRSQANRLRNERRKHKSARRGTPDAGEQEKMREEILAAVQRVRDRRSKREKLRSSRAREIPVTVK